jgi:DNA-binding MarR family transcriptional regulator
MKMNPESQSAPSLVGVDRLIHEPSRSVILAVLSAVDSADFLYLLRETGLTKGNLTVHLSKLEAAGYITIEKTYRGKLPLTLCHMTDKGRMAFKDYRHQLRNFLNDSKKD